MLGVEDARRRSRRHGNEKYVEEKYKRFRGGRFFLFLHPNFFYQKQKEVIK